MRILVVSDSHGSTHNLLEALRSEPTAEIVYFLGDGENDLKAVKPLYPERFIIAVKGNCDMYSSLPEKDVRTVENTRIYACHGYNEKVKYGNITIRYCARENECNLVLFGHTHLPEYIYDSELNMHLFNPGSVREGSYGVVDITHNGIMCINKKLPAY